MKNIFPRSQPRRQKYHSPIIEPEITDWHSAHRLPRHISAPESKSHRGGHNLGKIDCIPRVCQIDACKQNQANVALDILKYQLSDRPARQKHLVNARANIKHRLQVAKSTGNAQLISVLQAEYQQLKASI